ncbi:MAG: PEP-CTERM sorting domain-containing protein [Armatimonadota bacterium]|nr:PEP-CTERM sorting domain-containing protein [bacterium]
MKSKSILFLLLTMFILGCGTIAHANPAPAPSAFNYFDIHGITLTPALFTSNQFMYTITLQSDAYLLSGGNKYSVTDIWGFFAVSKTGDSFTANGPDYGDWIWDQHPNKGNSVEVAGWLNAPKNVAMITPESGSITKAFNFTDFSFSGSAPVFGLHLTVDIPAGLPSPFLGGGATGNVIPKYVPEPSSLLALLSGTTALCGLRIRRKK